MPRSWTRDQQRRRKRKVATVAARLLGKQVVPCSKCKKLVPKPSWFAMARKFECEDCDPIPF
jgi:hypothetical protein